MNDFTKEELEWLQEGLNELIAADSCEPERIWLKIKNMIDNYCEHPERKYCKKTGKPICPICHTHFTDNGDDIESRLQSYCNDQQPCE